MSYQHIQRNISNRGIPSDDFIQTIGETIAAMPISAFQKNANLDLYSYIHSSLGDPWRDDEQRRWAAAEAIMATGMFESGGNWNEDYDHSNPDENSPLTKSAGAFQVSPNSRYFGQDLRDMSPSDPETFRAIMKSDHPLAVRYILALLRHEVNSNGPVKRHEIDKWLSRASMAEWEALFGKGATTPPAPLPAPATVLVDERSEKNIATLHPKVQEAFRDFCRKANAAISPKQWKWICGTRTYEEQAKLHDAYVNHGGPQATSAGNSAHNFGIAMDGGVFGTDGSYYGEDPAYKTVGFLGRGLGFHWGADFGDEPHFAKRPPWAEQLGELQMMAELRKRHAAGIDVFA